VTSAQAHSHSAASLAETWRPGAGLLTAATWCRRTALPPVPESTKSARDFTAASLRWWGLPSLVQDAVLIASELAANAIRHAAPSAAGTAVELAWLHETSRLICMVTDASSLPPVLARPDPAAEGGRGLQIVDALAAAWGWAMLGTCQKAVWAALSLPAAAGPASCAPWDAA
jgi:anti-sigma regulatory factor (Ser/Thr protein kinase)